MDIYSGKGASHWLTVWLDLMTSHGFSLPKPAAFREILSCGTIGNQAICHRTALVDYGVSCVSGGYSVT